MKLADVLLKDMAILDAEPFESKDALFREMAHRFYTAGVTTDEKAFYNALYAREQEGPTVFADCNFAIPHGICDEVVQPGVGFVRFKTPMHYESCGEDGDIQYVFMLAIEGGNSEARNEHLQLLAQIARLMMHEDFMEFLATTDSYESLVEKIQNYNLEE